MNLRDLIGRDIAALKTDMAGLSNQIELLQMSRDRGGLREMCSIAARGEECARRLRERLHEIGLQIQQAQRSGSDAP